MTPTARRLYALTVLLSGIVAAVTVVVLAGRARRADRAVSDRRTVVLVSSALAARVDALSRAIRGPALAFDLSTLEPREVSGVLRLAFAQNDEITAVTLLDRDGTAVVPAAFLARAGAASGTGHTAESLDDLDRFAHQIPFQSAIARGRAVHGPYAGLREDSSRLAVAEAIPVADGTRTWVLSAEIDATHLLDGLTSGLDGADVLIVSPTASLGPWSALTDDARTALRARAMQPPREPELLLGADWRLAVMHAPGGLDGVVALAWHGEIETARRARLGEFALGIIVVSIIGAFAAGLAVAMRDSPVETADAKGAVAQAARDARVLGVVVKELANPIAAATAAAQLLTGETSRSRVSEMLQRSALRIERAFRRVTRLARASEETVRTNVDVAALVRTEAEALRDELEQAGFTFTVDARVEARALVDAQDVALLVQSLADAARTVAETQKTVRVRVQNHATDKSVVLSVSDAGALRARERTELMNLAEGTRVESSAPGVSWALAARIALDHHASIEMRDEANGETAAIITFARA